MQTAPSAQPPQRNLLLTLRYHGGHFHGSAIQKNAVTVQGVLQPALERIAGEPLALKCCSRTDAGVHARMFCVSFKTRCPIGCNRLVGAVNAVLPAGAAAYDCREVPPAFHARYSCKGKRYVYRVCNSPLRDPFTLGLCTPYAPPLDAEAMQRAAAHFLGTHDFSAFCAAGGAVEDKVRTITRCAVERRGEALTLEVAGDGFLYHMVRIMAGTLLQVGRGKLAEGRIPAILASRDRALAGPTAPPQGLWLEEVYY